MWGARAAWRHRGISPLVPPKDELLQPQCHSVPKACSIQPTSPLPRFCNRWCKTTRSGHAGAAHIAPTVTSTAFLSCLASYCAGVSMSPRISLAKLPDSSDFRSAIRSCKGIRVFHSPDPSQGWSEVTAGRTEGREAGRREASGETSGLLKVTFRGGLGTCWLWRPPGWGKQRGRDVPRGCWCTPSGRQLGKPPSATEESL